MEKHNCKLCLKSFANGRALGGHMRSHMLNLYISPNPPPPRSPEPLPSPSSSSSSENETESSRNATARRRSKRIRRRETSWFGDQQHFRDHSEYLKKSRTAESSTPEPPVSSISDTSQDEDLAYCLIMLSRDSWIDEEKNNTDNESESESDREIINFKRTPARTKYRCETCNKVFRSYQALGGHRASHKKLKLNHHNSNHQTQNVSMESKIHKCPVCFKVFASGQALGGHKRSHVTASSSSMAVEKQSINLIDLNLPAPVDDGDELSQLEVSVVSDGDFVKLH